MKILNLFKFWKWPKKIFAIIIILILAGGGLYFYQQSKKPKEELRLAQVKRSDIKSTISASGQLNGDQSAALKFKLSGKLAYLNVKTGDRVTKGQVIAGLDTQELAINLRQAELNYLSKDATAKRVEDDVKNNEDDENFTQREERMIAQTARDSAYDEWKDAQRAFQDTVITTPISGIVTISNFLPGQNVSVADIIVQIVSESDHIFDAEVDESDIGKVQIGQTAAVTLNSFEDRIFTGTVSEIKPLTHETSSGATVVIVKVNLGKPDISFISGINGQAEIVYEQVFNALTIPQEALIDEKEVIVKAGNQYQKVPVLTGLFSDTEVEITSGLSEGQEVVLNPSAVKL